MEIYKQIDNLIRTMDFNEMLPTIGKAGSDGNTSLVVAGGAVASACVVVWASRKLFGRLATWNLPGPRDSVFLLDLLNRNKREHQLHLLLDDYVQSYGPLFAFNHKGQPTVVTCDEEMIHNILWKEFTNFQDRKFFEQMPWPSQDMITMAKGGKAKAIRNLLRSVLEADSIKNGWTHFVEATQSVDDIFKDASIKSSTVDAAGLANGFIMQILAKIAFSLDFVNQSEMNMALINYSHQFTRPPTWLQTCSDIPILKYFTNHLPWGYGSRIAPFIKIGLNLVKERRALGNQHQDILDILLTAQSNDKSITDELLLAQAIVLLTAVHAATSTTITTATYLIAKHKDIQQKLQEEIDNLCTDGNDDGMPTYDQLHQDLKYMDQVIHETLRLYPSAFMLMRECTKATTVNNIQFKEGDAVLIPSYSIHRNPKIYENPEQFDPERFQKRPTKHYYAFGDGYRRCAGRQMAFSEMKMYLYKVLKNYNISLADPTQELNIKTYVTVQAMMAVEEPVKLLVKKR